jgi:hypothetical protein
VLENVQKNKPLTAKPVKKQKKLEGIGITTVELYKYSFSFSCRGPGICYQEGLERQVI